MRNLAHEDVRAPTEELVLFPQAATTGIHLKSTMAQNSGKSSGSGLAGSTATPPN